MNVVYVNLPKVKFDTIIFTWSHLKRTAFFKNNSFYIKYDGINIEKLPIEYFWYSFLSIMIPLYNFCEEDVLFKFPTPVPSSIAELWINYHDGKRIYIDPIINSNDIDLKKSSNISSSTNVGILFGGGKDSTYALSVLNEIYGHNNIVLISYVLPYMDNIIEKHDKRRDIFVLEPLKKKMKIKVQKIYSNFYSNLTEQKYKYSTHIAIYLGPLIPILIEYGISTITYSHEFICYRTGVYNKDEIVFNYKRSRPEYANYVSQLTSNIINRTIDIINFNYYISEIGAFKVLAHRYPERLKNILMCENIPNMRKWCLNCTKCGTYVFCSMCYGNKYMEINLNNFFENSNYIKKLLRVTDNLINQRNEDNNCPWVQEFCPKGHYGSLCHVIASINIEKYKKILSTKAFSNLCKIKDRYGNKEYPIFESFLQPAFMQVSPPLPEKVKEIVGSHCIVTSLLPKYFEYDNVKVTFDYNAKCNIPKIFDIEKNNSFLISKIY